MKREVNPNRKGLERSRRTIGTPTAQKADFNGVFPMDQSTHVPLGSAIAYIRDTASSATHTQKLKKKKRERIVYKNQHMNNQKNV